MIMFDFLNDFFSLFVFLLRNIHSSFSLRLKKDAVVKINLQATQKAQRSV